MDFKLLDDTKAILETRRKQYGPPNKEFEEVALMWSVLAGADITAEQVGLMMIALKMIRHKNNYKRDNVVDIAGYAQCLDDLHKDEACRTIT